MQAHNKLGLRKAARRARAALAPAERQKINSGIFTQVIHSEVFLQSECIMVYCSFGDEIDTWQIIDHCFRQGKTVCVPRCEAGGRLHAYRISGMGDLVSGTMGILEPKASCPRQEKIGLILVPCLCADRKGFRIGYGGGYYDRFLPKTRARTAVLCAHAHFLDTVYPEAFDYPCEKVITERGVYPTYEK